jgi:protein SCO1/2
LGERILLSPNLAFARRALLLLLVAAAPGEIELPAGAKLGGPFQLRDQAGEVVTEARLRGHWTLLYFGYASCPDVCPTELQTVASAIEALPPEVAARVLPVFVTIDPERDTPEHLARYVALFHPRLVGLTGTPDQVAAVARAYRVFYKRVESSEAGGYMMDHSSMLYLLDQAGAVRALFRSETAPEDLAAALRRWLG